MPTILETHLPDGITPESIRADLEDLTAGAVSIDIQPSARSGSKGQLGQIDPTQWEIIIQLLDTKAAAAAVQTVTQSIPVIIAYLLGRTGRKPKVTEKPDTDAEKP